MPCRDGSIDAKGSEVNAETGSSRKEFNLIIEDCNDKKLDIVITKSISRFGRDIVEILDVISQLKVLGVRVIFEQEELDTVNTDSDLMIAVIKSIAQAENESRSENIKWGIKQRVASGKSKLYDRKCYGYRHDADGNLVLDEQTAENVKLIFDLYLRGCSVLEISPCWTRDKIKEAQYGATFIYQSAVER
ncbi:MAG: recombinase family protein [Lachnospiraceae bacterium]|nr:recombinase family protein [Lachnospiraceae bacterium]